MASETPLLTPQPWISGPVSENLCNFPKTTLQHHAHTVISCAEVRKQQGSELLTLTPEQNNAYKNVFLQSFFRTIDPNLALSSIAK